MFLPKNYSGFHEHVVTIKTGHKTVLVFGPQFNCLFTTTRTSILQLEASVIIACTVGLKSVNAIAFIYTIRSAVDTKVAAECVPQNSLCNALQLRVCVIPNSCQKPISGPMGIQVQVYVVQMRFRCKKRWYRLEETLVLQSLLLEAQNIFRAINITLVCCILFLVVGAHEQQRSQRKVKTYSSGVSFIKQYFKIAFTCKLCARKCLAACYMPTVLQSFGLAPRPELWARPTLQT